MKNEDILQNAEKIVIKAVIPPSGDGVKIQYSVVMDLWMIYLIAAQAAINN